MSRLDPKNILVTPPRVDMTNNTIQMGHEQLPREHHNQNKLCSERPFMLTDEDLSFLLWRDLVTVPSPSIKSRSVKPWTFYSKAVL